LSNQEHFVPSGVRRMWNRSRLWRRWRHIALVWLDSEGRRFPPTPHSSNHMFPAESETRLSSLPSWVRECWHQLVASGTQVKICGLEVPAFPANAVFKYLPTEVSLLVPPFRLLLLFQGHWNLTQHGGTYPTYNFAVQSNYDPALVLVSTVTLPDLSSTFQRAFLHYTFRAFSLIMITIPSLIHFPFRW